MKTVTKEQRLQAYALFVIAIKRNNEANDFSREAAKVLGIEVDGHLSDAIFGWKVADPSEAAFDEMLRKEGLTTDIPEPA